MSFSQSAHQYRLVNSYRKTTTYSYTESARKKKRKRKHFLGNPRKKRIFSEISQGKEKLSLINNKENLEKISAKKKIENFQEKKVKR